MFGLINGFFWVVLGPCSSRGIQGFPLWVFKRYSSGMKNPNPISLCVQPKKAMGYGTHYQSTDGSVLNGCLQQSCRKNRAPHLLPGDSLSQWANVLIEPNGFTGERTQTDNIVKDRRTQRIRSKLQNDYPHTHRELIALG